MFLDEIKRKFNPFLLIVGSFAAKLGFTPTLATGIGFIFLVLAVVLTYIGFLFYGGIALLINFFFDAIDGSIARATNQVTKLGLFLDRTADQFRECIWIVLGLAGFIPLELAAAAVFLEALGSLIPRLVENNQMKTLRWVPSWIGWIMIFGLLTGKVIFITWIFIILQAGLLIFEIISIIILNRKSVI